MWRSIGAALAGLAVMVFMVATLEWLGHSLYPLPPGLDYSNPEVMAALVAAMPPAAKLFPLLGYALGGFLGAYTAVTISVAHRRGVAMVIGSVLLVAVAMNLTVIPHPAWMALLSVLVPPPCVWLGHRWASRP